MIDDIPNSFSFSAKDKLYNSNNLNQKAFIIYKDSLSYKIKLVIEEGFIKLKSLNYELKLSKEEFSNIIGIEFKTLNNAFNFIIDSFSLGNINLKEIISNKIIKLNIIQKKGENNSIELNLINNNGNKDFIINEIYNEHKNKFIFLEKENDQLRKELDKLKYEIKQLKLKQMNAFKNNSNKSKKNEEKKFDNFIDFNNLKLNSELTQNSYCSNSSNNTFIIFNSINNISYLVYSTSNKSIISYNFFSQKINIEIKNAHKNFISNFRHFCDIKNKKDIIMSLSDLDNQIKLWDCNIWECILILDNINTQGFLNSGCFLNDNDELYIITSNWSFNDVEKIKVFNINGEKIKEINDSNDKTVYITSYNDEVNSKNYIITGNDGYIKSYDFSENRVYHKYKKKQVNNSYYCLIVKYYKNNLCLIGSCFDGYIRIWDFHKGDYNNSFYSGAKGLIGLCFWDDKFLFCGDSDKLLKVMDLESGIIIKKYFGLNEALCTVQKIDLPNLGECVITQGLLNDQIKMWNFKK